LATWEWWPDEQRFQGIEDPRIPGWLAAKPDSGIPAFERLRFPAYRPSAEIIKSTKER
jgi:hypothetical protein